MNFRELNESKIGNLGEELVKKSLEKIGFVVYETRTEKSHPIDFICFDNLDNMFLFEVKTKPHRWSYDETGIDLRSWNRYKKLIEESCFKIYLYFVDEFEEKIYYISINKIINDKTKYKIRHDDNAKRGIVYFYLKDMKIGRDLTNDEILKFKELRESINHKLDEYKYRNKYFK